MNKDDDVGVVNLLKSQTSSICTLKILEYMYEEGSSKTTLKFRTFELKEKYCRIQFVLTSQTQDRNGFINTLDEASKFACLKKKY
jgi:hypothetical protein